jgi:hypothetical protein
MSNQRIIDAKWRNLPISSNKILSNDSMLQNATYKEATIIVNKLIWSTD